MRKIQNKFGDINRLSPMKMLEFSNGCFWLISSCRSGHNYIKNNIESWFDNSRYYIDLEQINPINFSEEETYTMITPELYSTSFKIVNVRDLLNWYIAAVFLINRYKRNPNKIKTHPKIENLKWEWEIEQNKNLSYNPFNVVIPNEFTKERIMEIYYNPNGRFGERLPIEERAKKLINNWCDITKEFLGITDYVKGSIGVHYDEFFQSQSYRISICNKLGGQYNEKELNKVTEIGDYSTFDKDKFQNRAQEMNVLERYKLWDTLEENRELLSLLKNHEALELYLNNFDVNDDKKRFIDKWIT